MGSFAILLPRYAGRTSVPNFPLVFPPPPRTDVTRTDSTFAAIRVVRLPISTRSFKLESRVMGEQLLQLRWYFGAVMVDRSKLLAGHDRGHLVQAQRLVPVVVHARVP